MKTASEMTYIVSSGALNSSPTKRHVYLQHAVDGVRLVGAGDTDQCSSASTTLTRRCRPRAVTVDEVVREQSVAVPGRVRPPGRADCVQYNRVYIIISCLYVHRTDFTGIKVATALCRLCLN